MAAGIGSKIEWSDYQAIQTLAAKVLGTGTGSYGYGQTISSSATSQQFQKITTQQWLDVRRDILRCRMHQTGVDYSASLTSPTTDIKLQEADRLAYLNMATLAETNALVVASTQATRATIVSAVFEDTWYTSVGLTYTVEFPTYDDGRYFFNAGGQIEISSSRAGGTSPSPKNSTWSTMLSTMGNIIFNYTSTTKTGTGGTGSTIGFYDLTTSDQKIFEQNAPTGGSYSLNKFVINAKKNVSGTQIIFTIQYLDLATYTNTTVFGPGLGPYGLDEAVDGTLTNTVKTYRATQPTGVDSVEVSNPSIFVSNNWSIIEGGDGSTIAPSVVITPATLTNPQVEIAYNQTFTATGGTSPYTWSYTGQLPAGLSLSTGGVLSGTPATAQGYSFAITATDSTGYIGVKGYTVTVSQPTITVSPTSLTAPKVGTSYGVSFSATGGTGPYSWQSSGTLPPGLSLTTGGVLSGIPTTSGTYSFTIQVFDRFAAPGARAFSVTVAAASVITILPSTISNSAMQKGVAYSQTFTASGGTAPYLWTSGGAVPSGLSLTTGGVLSGTPTADTTYTFTIKAQDSSAGAYSATNSYTVTVQAPVLPPVPTITVTPTTPSTMAVDSAYSRQYSATGGTAPYTFSLVNVLPPGIGLSPGGLVSGTPSFDAGGKTYSYGIRATDQGGYSGTRAVSITVTAAPPPTTNISPASSTEYVSYGDTFNTASSGSSGFQVNCTANYGLVDMSGRVLSGQTGGTATTNIDQFSISSGNSRTVVLNYTQARGSLQNPWKYYADANTGGTHELIVMRSASNISSPAPGNYSLRVGVAQSFQFTGSGAYSPFTNWEVSQGTLPTGLNLSSSGLLSGTIVASAVNQTFIFKVRSLDSVGVYMTEGTYTVTTTA